MISTTFFIKKATLILLLEEGSHIVALYESPSGYILGKPRGD